MRKHVFKPNYFALLTTLFLVMLTAPLAPLLQAHFAFFRGSMEITPQMLLITIVTAWTAWRNVHFRFIPMLIGAIIVLSLGLLSAFFTHVNLAQVHLAAQTVFLSFAVVALVKEILTSRNVNSETLAGAICVYLLLGIIGGLIFALIEISAPGSFYVSSELAEHTGKTFESNPGVMIYFAFVTLTTVGYGDIIPANETARSACTLLAVLGQLTLVLLISRLVGLRIAKPAPPPKNT
jgi:voltage-gated potassium channel Kch